MRRNAIAALTLTALLAGCGSGTPHVAKSAPPVKVETTSVAFHIMPTKVPAGGTRRTKYISYGTQSAKIAIDSPGVPTTTTVIRCSYGACNGTVDAPVATDTFTVTLYDDWGAQGNVLSAGSTTQTIVKERANSVNITFDGVPKHVTVVTLDVASPLIGAPSTTNVHVNAVDATGYTIVGAGNYNPPIQLTLNDPTASTSLSKPTVDSPDDVVTLSYNGTPKVLATLSAALQGGAVEASATFEPANVSAEFAIPNPDGTPRDIVKGPDGAMWFTESGGLKIGRIDGNGLVKEYATTDAPSSIIVGPDGALWFTEVGQNKQYGRITTDGSLTEYGIAVPPPGTPTSATALAFGADGNLYVADDGNNPGVYVVTPATGALVKSYTNWGNAYPNAVVSGPDNNIWVAVSNNVAQIRLSDGFVSNFVTSGTVASVTAGPDGNVWFTDSSGKIGSVTATGSVTEYAIPRFVHNTYKIIAAADGTFWFTYGRGTGGDGGMCRLGHATAAGAISSYAIADCNTPSLAFGSDGNLWLAESTRKKIGIFSSFAGR
ncbi:MAG: lyase-like protein [Candidatus Eremiobacteraeota bacterium]|nr:lyase-like protein [Candidatus Eremiobacteraeota bacterium]